MSGWLGVRYCGTCVGQTRVCRREVIRGMPVTGFIHSFPERSYHYMIPSPRSNGESGWPCCRDHSFIGTFYTTVVLFRWSVLPADLPTCMTLYLWILAQLDRFPQPSITSMWCGHSWWWPSGLSPSEACLHACHGMGNGTQYWCHLVRSRKCTGRVGWHSEQNHWTSTSTGLFYLQ